MTNDDNVKPLPVKFKKPPGEDEPFLKVVSGYGKGECNHRYQISLEGHTSRATYYLREGLTEVECSLCGQKLDPMFVLKIMATEENNWSRAREHHLDEMKRLNERRRTKCWHCGKMTEISRR